MTKIPLLIYKDEKDAKQNWNGLKNLFGGPYELECCSLVVVITFWFYGIGAVGWCIIYRDQSRINIDLPQRHLALIIIFFHLQYRFFRSLLGHITLSVDNRPLADAELQVLALIPIAYCRIRAIFSSRQIRFFVSCVIIRGNWNFILILKYTLIFWWCNTIFFNQHLRFYSFKLMFKECCLHVKADDSSIFPVCLSKRQFVNYKFLKFLSFLVIFFVLNKVFWGMIRLTLE